MVTLQNRTALVTGASAGIGRAFAEELAARGFHLVITARRKERLDELATQLAARHGVRVEVVTEDLADPAGPERLLGTLAARGLVIDVLVNNAGFGIPAYFVRTSWQEQAAAIQLMVTSVAQLTHALLPGMLERDYGRIVHVASLAGLIPGAPGSTLYAGAKSFCIKFAESLAAELGASNVHVCAVCPGFTYSEFHDVNGTRETVSKMPAYMWMDAGAVARQGLDAVMAGQSVHVNGGWNRLVAAVLRHAPQPFARSLVGRRAKDFRPQNQT
jgi:short-subunit dehydrogenase